MSTDSRRGGGGMKASARAPAAEKRRPNCEVWALQRHNSRVYEEVQQRSRPNSGCGVASGTPTIYTDHNGAMQSSMIVIGVLIKERWV